VTVLTQEQPSGTTADNGSQPIRSKPQQTNPTGTTYREIAKGWRRLRALREFFKRGADLRYSWYRLKWNYASRWDWVTPFPTHVDIEPSDECNLRCIMCPQAFEEWDKGFIDVALAKRIIDECTANRVYSIKFTWRGEPALHKGLEEMISYAKQKGIPEVQITTNGIPFTDERIGRIIDSGIDRMIFSVDGATKETYERIRVGSSYDRLIHNIKRVAEIRKAKGRVKPFLRVQMVRMKDNVAEVEAFKQFWATIVDDVRFSDVTDRGQGGQLSVGDQVAVGRRRCPQPWQRLVVGWNGKVAMCCGDWHQEQVVGDVRTQTLKEIWHSERMQEMRDVQRQLRLNQISPCDKCFVKESYVWQKVDGQGTPPQASSQGDSSFVEFVRAPS
jgi:radical SAM protein with 4Fe4S-binding SPASM domain